jgi:hypothetical protein
MLGQHPRLEALLLELAELELACGLSMTPQRSCRRRARPQAIDKVINRVRARPRCAGSLPAPTPQPSCNIACMG